MWATVVELRRPRSFDVVRQKLLNVAREGVDVDFDEYGTISLTFTAKATGAAEAIRTALEEFALLMLTAELTLEPHTVSTFPAGAQPAIRLVGTREIADILGVSKGRVSQIMKQANFPAPVAKPAMGPVFRESAIRKYHKERQESVERRELAKLRRARATLLTAAEQSREP